ncbi:DinB family protein [uncultured Polaribacter sp.]|uniref:DinB family protein n=1 Tax=uncultured Polaribacter sp. TaxID=174711 RepID=UPI00260FD828|nr:DinB family protein [uncultured Polaribacter sp.]
MIEAITQNLQKGVDLLKNITNAQYSDRSVAPYQSSIGCHMRHVLDVFSCFFNGLDKNHVDFSVRERNECAETQTEAGITYFKSIITNLEKISPQDFDKKIQVTDNLGLGNETVTYTIGAVLMQMQSHAIHHYATIGYLVHQLNITLPKNSFGYNPTTPNKVNA